MNECGVETLYRNLLDRWNHGDAAGFAALFREDGSIVAAAVVTSEPVALRDFALFLEGSLADYKRPAQMVGGDELPRNQNGKVVPGDVRDLINRLLNGFEVQP